MISFYDAAFRIRFRGHAASFSHIASIGSIVIFTGADICCYIKDTKAKRGMIFPPAFSHFASAISHASKVMS